MTNLLKNPGFEGEYQPWRGQASVLVAEGWLPFWIVQRPSDEPWRNRQPVYRPAAGATDSRLVRAGQTAQMYSTSWGTHTAGLMQSVSVRPGQGLRFKAYGYAWSTDSDTPGKSPNPGNVRMKIGLDPTGGTTPFGAGVIWSVERAVYDRYDAGFMVEATATHPSMTAFLLSTPEWPKKHNDIYWDDASLEVIRDVGGLSDEASGDEVVLLLTSETQRLGQPVTVRVTSPYLLEDVHLNVSGPAGGVTLRRLGISSTGRGHAWRWEFVPAMGGPYTATVSAVGINAISTTIQIVDTAAFLDVPSQLRPAVRGQPRAQYERTYVLLPPGAGKEWVQAVIDSSMWLNKHWTLGFSRDDAGIGDLDKRTVIVVNPSAWPEPADVWFALWYPGVRVRTITAASPSELPTALRAFVL